MNLRLVQIVLKTELLNLKSILLVTLLSFLFLFLSFVIINYKSYTSFIFNGYDILTKLNIIYLIFIGTFTATSKIDIVLVLIMSALFGVNMTLVINKFSALKRRGNLRIMFGTGIISVFAAGCASCGLSFASLIGISAVLAILPFGGIELYFLAILILTISLYFNLKQIIKVCNIS